MQQVKQMGLFMLLVGLLASAYLFIQYSQASTQNEKLKSELTQMHLSQQAGIVNSDDKELELDIQRASAVIDRLAFPWDSLFKALESSAISKDIGLLSIQPDIANGVITLNAEAKNWNVMLRYIRELNNESFFKEVYLVNHQIQLADPRKPVRFTLLCSLRVNFQ